MRAAITLGGAAYARGRRPQARVTVADGLPPGTALEARLYAALDALGARYAPQWPLGEFRVDAWLPDLRLVIEADGCFWHGCPQHAPERAAWHATKRLWRDGKLRAAGALRVEHFWQHECEDELSMLRRVQAALASEEGHDEQTGCDATGADRSGGRDAGGD